MTVYSEEKWGGNNLWFTLRIVCDQLLQCGNDCFRESKNDDVLGPFKYFDKCEQIYLFDFHKELDNENDYI